MGDEETPIDKGLGTENKQQLSPVQDEKKESGTNYIIAIGIDEYDKASLRLPNCKKDCEDVIKAFQGGFKKFEMYKELYNKDASRQGILDAIDAFCNDEKCNNPFNNLIIYYSGHGGFVNTGERKVPSWIPCDYIDNEKRQFLRIDDLKRDLEFVKTCHLLVIADCCFAAGIFKFDINVFSEPVEREGAGESSAEDVGLEPSRYGLAACRAYQTTGAGDVGKNSVFSRELINALQQNLNLELRFSLFVAALRATLNAKAGPRVEYEKLHISKSNTGDFTLIGNEIPIYGKKRSSLLEKEIISLNYTNQKKEFSKLKNNRALIMLSGTPDCGLNFVMRQLKGSMYFPTHTCWPVNAQIVDGTDEQRVLNLFKMAGKGEQPFNTIDELRKLLLKKLQDKNLVLEVRFYAEAAPLGDITQKRKRIIEELATFSESVNNMVVGDNRLCILIIDFEDADYPSIVPGNKISQTEAIIFEKVKELDKTQFLDWYNDTQGRYRIIPGEKSDFNLLFDDLLFNQAEVIFPDDKKFRPGYVIQKICVLSNCHELAEKLLN